VTNSGTEKEGGGQQVGIGLAAAAKCGLAAGLLVFLVGAALLALVDLVAETGVVETQTVVAAALGCPRVGRAAAAGPVGGRSGKEAAGSGRPRLRRKQPPQGSGTSTMRCKAGSSPLWC
jgi:hypothetical protein